MKLIVVGAPSYIGAGIIRQALTRSDITSVIAVTRRPLEQTAARLQNVIVPDYCTYSAAAKEALAGAGACIWTVGVTPRHAFRMDPEEVRKICQDYTMAGLEAMRSSGLARLFRVAYLSAVAVPRDVNQNMWFAPKFRLTRVRYASYNYQASCLNCLFQLLTSVDPRSQQRTRLSRLRRGSEGAVEAVIAKPGPVPDQGGMPLTALATISRGLGIGVTVAVVLDDLAIALIDQVVHGIEKDPLWPADFNRLAQQVKYKKGLN
ncbi:nucleoside-diphosphate-sugar epimerase [Fusarium agapanthi]|uniref:Nucleoside-diphosphate-sugar epimerase n=1 Tax=Fusarium agapanthi TaxID=1803897 RepID=A0A9P5B804_9HYPO|nr:nucleoside-diphosphate-sugar epimerase [Fusarium agapanthi]